MSTATISHEEARQVYDRIGSWVDTLALYEDVATRDLTRNGRFDSAEAIFEFGCGTGRFAKMLLRDHLSPTASYRAFDVSRKMVALARAKLAPFEERVQIILSEGGPPTAEPAGSCDRFVSNYVFDLLSESDIAAVFSEAHRMLRPGGLLCLSSLSPARGPISRTCMGAWSFVHRRRPRLVGGCRAIELLPFLSDRPWRLLHHRAIAPLGIPFEVVIAECLGAA